MTHVPLLIDASMTARCDMLLSPGTSSSVWMVGARRIFQSDIGIFGKAQAISPGLGLGQKFDHEFFAVE